MIDFPIGTPEERRSAITGLPGNWKNSNPFATHYEIKPGVWNYHDGVDLNLNVPTFNADWHKPVYAVDDGVVTYAGPGSGTWGHVIDTKHDKDGHFYVSRVGHIENILVKTGDLVTAGQQIASVGTGDGQFTAHLHWNISKLDDPIMLNDPDQWCGASLSCVLEHYVDPVQFVLDAKKGAPPMPIPTPTITEVMALDNLIIRSAPSVTSPKLPGRIDQYAIFEVVDYQGAVAYTKLNGRPGYVSTSWITAPLLAQVMRVTADPSLRVRAKPNASAEIIDRLPLGRVIQVWRRSEIGSYIRLVDQPGWVSVQYLEPLATDSPLVDNIPDLSHFTVITDFDAAFKNAPLLIHKGTQGVSYVDPLFRQRRSDFLALNPGGSVLVWHNGTNHDPILQAKHCLRTCADGVTGIGLDLETISADEGGTMTLAQAEDFVEYIHDQTGKWIAVYTRPGYLPATASVLSNCPLWLASAAHPPILPFQWQNKGWRLLQYDQKRLEGFRDPVDINRYWNELRTLKPFIQSIAPAAPDDQPPGGGTGGGGIWGLNIDPYNSVGEPLIRDSLKGSSFVRLSFQVADQRQTLAQAFAFYDPIVAAYAALGVKVLLILSQSSYNQNMPYPGAPYVWADFIPGFATFCSRVAIHYAGEVWGLEIWNEPDVQGQPTSVYVPPEAFGEMLRAIFRSMAGAPTMKIVSGGLASADPVGYLKQAGDLTNALHYIGVHPYGKTLPNLTNIPGASGMLRPYLDKFAAAFPGKPLAITEYGFAGPYTADPQYWPIMAQYMRETFAVIQDEFAQTVKLCIWFAYSDGMAEAGIVTIDRKPKGAVFVQYFANAGFDTNPSGGTQIPDPATRYVIANPYVNVRSGPGVTYDDIGDLLYRTELLVDLTTMQNGFIRIINSEPAAPERWVSLSWIGPTQPPEPIPQPPATPPPPKPTKTKIGFHVVQSDNWFRHRDFLLNMFHAGALAGVTIVNNTELANILVQAGVPYVIHRTVRDGYEGIPQLSGTADDKRKGRDCYYGNNQLTTLDKKVIIQPFGYNESNRPNDGYFAYGIAEAATEDGRHVVLFNDPVGNPDAWLNPDGSFNCPTFKARAASGVLEYMVKNNHYYGYHGYGPGGSGAKPPATGNEPGSSINPDGTREDDRWKWYGGRIFYLYKTVPETMRPLVILDEAGFFNADFTKGGGVPAVLNDTSGYEIRLASEPLACSANLWTLGEKFAGGSSDISAAIPAYEAAYIR